MIENADEEIPNTSGLVKETDYDTKITEIENKIPSLDCIHTAGTKPNSLNYVYFFLCGCSFMNIHKSQDCTGRGRAFHYLTTTSTHFSDTWTLARQLLRRAHLCT